MKFSVSVRDLAEQLPEIRNDIFQFYEDRVILRGTPLEEMLADSVEKELTILREFPEFDRIFTPRELQLLQALYDKKPSKQYLCTKLDMRENTICVHVKDIRKKIIRHGLPFRVQTKRNLYYTLVRKAWNKNKGDGIFDRKLYEKRGSV